MSINSSLYKYKKMILSYKIIFYKNFKTLKMNSINNQNIFIDFNSIFASWDNNVSSSDIYHMILNWINQYKSYIKSIHIIENILERMESNDSTNDIDEDFIYGNIYQELRDEFQS